MTAFLVALADLIRHGGSGEWQAIVGHSQIDGVALVHRTVSAVWAEPR